MLEFPHIGQYIRLWEIVGRKEYIDEGLVNIIRVAGKNEEYIAKYQELIVSVLPGISPHPHTLEAVFSGWLPEVGTLLEWLL